MRAHEGKSKMTSVNERMSERERKGGRERSRIRMREVEPKRLLRGRGGGGEGGKLRGWAASIERVAMITRRHDKE